MIASLIWINKVVDNFLQNKCGIHYYYYSYLILLAVLDCFTNVGF